MKVHIVLKDGLSEEEKAAVLQNAIAYGLANFNQPRFEKFGLLSGDIEESLLEAFRGLRGVKSVNPDQKRRVLQSKSQELLESRLSEAAVNLLMASSGHFYISQAKQMADEFGLKEAYESNPEIIVKELALADSYFNVLCSSEERCMEEITLAVMIASMANIRTPPVDTFLAKVRASDRRNIAWLAALARELRPE